MSRGIRLLVAFGIALAMGGAGWLCWLFLAHYSSLDVSLRVTVTVFVAGVPPAIFGVWTQIKPKAKALWRVGNYPQAPVAFQTRLSLAAKLLSGRGQPGPIISVLAGGRGNGKTQLAGAYARKRIADKWRLVAWVNGSTAASVISGLAEVARTIGIATAREDAQACADRARHWLEMDGSRCLVVFDNVESAEDLRAYLPAKGRSHIVITTSHQAITALGVAVTVDEFTQAEGLGYLWERTKSDDHEGALQVGKTLGWMPLALSQAAALMVRDRIDYRTYLSRLQAQGVTEFVRRVQGSNYPYDAAKAIALSLEGALGFDDSGYCESVLEAVAIGSETGVSRRMLRALEINQVAPDDSKVDAAIGILAEASLVWYANESARDSQDLRVVAHRLVMWIVRERLVEQGHLAAIVSLVLEALGALIDDLNVKDIAWARELVRQTRALNFHVGELIVTADPLALQLLVARRRSLLVLLDHLGQSYRGIADGESLVADTERILGRDHLETLAARTCLAYAYEEAGQLDKAIPLSEQSLTDCLRTLGPEHPDTLRSTHYLARAYRLAGQFDSAIALLEANLVARERILGFDHLDTLMSRSQLASVYKLAGQLGKAVPLSEQTVADCERVLGVDHPDTLKARHNLAGAYQLAGKLDQAIALYERTAADRRRTLGRDYHATIASRRGLADAYLAAGRLDKAVPLYEQTLADRERVLGPDHPDTLSSRNRLGRAYQLAGKTAKAHSLLVRTLADCERVLSPGHPIIEAVRNNLAVTPNPSDEGDWERDEP